MPFRRRFILRLQALRHDQRGIAIPTALMALVASFALASVAVMSSIDVQQGTKRDHDSKEAIAAADAGANLALLRLNRFVPLLSTTTPCIGPSGEEQKATGGWCPATTTQSTGNGRFSYTISAYVPGGALNIVSVGNSGTVSRRVNISLSSIAGKNVFADERLIGQDSISLGGSSLKIETDVGTNGSITQDGHPTICGDDRHGPGKEAPTPTCNGVKTEGIKNLPLVIPPTNIATENSNCRLTQNCPIVKEVDPYTKQNPWTSKTRIINMKGQGTLTMGGKDYLVCGVFINSGTLYMAAEAHVRIFVDTPEHCGLASGAVQVEISGNANIKSSGLNPAQGLFDVPGIYMLGNGAVNLEGTSGGNEVMLYAPQSAVDIGGNAEWKGMIAGKTLTIHGTPLITSNSNIKEPVLPLSSLLQRTRYVECTGASSTPPNANC